MIANFPSFTNSEEPTEQKPVVSLGLGTDLDPKFLRWFIPGGIGGFLLWAVTSPNGMPLHDLFHQRGPTQIFCLIMGGILLSFMISKWRLLKREEKAFLQFDVSIPKLIRSGDLSGVRNKAENSSSLVGKRLFRLLDVWDRTGSAFQLERSADADAELYELSTQSSYGLAKVLLWAIPLMGFIGTVIGMSKAVGSFDQVLGNADNVDGLKNGLVKVTSGLGTAFDTTYLALVISVIFAFPLNACEQLEDRLLRQVDGEVRDAVMALSPLGEGEIPLGDAETSYVTPAAKGLQPEEITALSGQVTSDIGELISDAFEKHLPDPSVLVEPAQQYAEQLTEAALDKLSPLTNIVRDSVEGVAEARLSLQDQAEVIRNSMDELANELNKTLVSMGPVLNRLEKNSKQSRTEAEELDQLQAMIELRQSVETLNKNISRLGPARRRWPWSNKDKT